MKTIKIGGGCLNGKDTIRQILELIAQRGKGNIFVVSALNGITDLLIKGMDQALQDEESIPALMENICTTHLAVLNHVICPCQGSFEFEQILNKELKKLERLYYGLNFTREASLRMQDIISSYGERLSALLLTHILKCQGHKAITCMPHEIGIVTDGKFSDASARLKKTSVNFTKNLLPLINNETIIFIPGFFGISEQGDITTFGRGGSDYSAAVVAVCLEADALEIWKDVAGFMSADPRLIKDAHLIPTLSYEEAAELAYFGAKILHPRTVEPVRRKKCDILIKNTLSPDSPGTCITSTGSRTSKIIKSVAHSTDVGVLKIHGSGVGARPGILGTVASCLTEAGLNIKSVVTSQTCISVLLHAKDLDKGYKAVKTIDPKPYRTVEKVEDLALVSIVGEGLLPSRGVAAQCFSAVAEHDINIEMISFGPSKAALYFLVKTNDLPNAVQAIHDTFFKQ